MKALDAIRASGETDSAGPILGQSGKPVVCLGCVLSAHLRLVGITQSFKIWWVFL